MHDISPAEEEKIEATMADLVEKQEVGVEAPPPPTEDEEAPARAREAGGGVARGASPAPSEGSARGAK
jgi:hypothetical protein